MIDQVEIKVQNSNERMKYLIQEMNPNRCCIASFLFFILIGLAVVIVRFFISS